MSYEGGTVIDVGGICEDYHVLETLFHPADLHAQTLTRKVQKGVPSIVANAYQLPFKDEPCEIITSFDVLEHLLQPERFVSEASRVLRPDGLFILVIANLGHIYSRIVFLLGTSPSLLSQHIQSGIAFKDQDLGAGHKSAFTYRAVKELLDCYGFQIIGLSGYDYVEAFYRQIPGQKEREIGFGGLRRLLSAILPTSLDEGMILFCKKKNETYS